MKDNIIKILSEGNYLSKTTKTKDGRMYNGITTVKYIKDDNKNTVGIKIKHNGEDNHEDTVYYFFTGNDIISLHTSDITNASHNSTITKVTNNTIINKGIGFSHSMNSQVKFKKLIKKNTQTNDVLNLLTCKCSLIAFEFLIRRTRAYFRICRSIIVQK